MDNPGFIDDTRIRVPSRLDAYETSNKYVNPLSRCKSDDKDVVASKSSSSRSVKEGQPPSKKQKRSVNNSDKQSKYLVPAPRNSVSPSAVTGYRNNQSIPTVSAGVLPQFCHPPPPLRKTLKDPHVLGLPSGGKTKYMAKAKLKRRPLFRFWKLSFAKSDHSKRRMVMLYCILIFAVVLILSTGVFVIYLTVFGGLNDPPLKTASSTLYSSQYQNDQAVIGRFRLSNVEFLSSYRDSTSEDFRKKSEEIEDQMNILFSTSSISSMYNYSKVERLRRGSVLVESVVTLTMPTGAHSAEKVGLAFFRGLKTKHNKLWLGPFVVDIHSLSFTDAVVHQAADSGSNGEINTSLIAAWGSWSDWSECKRPCRQEYTQTRTRKCRLGEGTGEPLSSIEPCLFQSTGGDFSMRPCNCTVTVNHDSFIIDSQASTVHNAYYSTEVIKDIDNNHVDNEDVHGYCSNCTHLDVCVALGRDPMPSCHTAIDLRDPTGCGGLCLLEVQVCHKFDTNAYRCVNTSFCLIGEWQCGNRLCIPDDRRCDGHMNCYDRTDEDSCDCNLSTHFHCGHLTSCLPNSKRCNGRVDCWDGSDEFNCTEACPTPNDFTCNTGQCIDKSRFCDGFPDCKDHSDEPLGCKGECKKYEWRCSNDRCILKDKRCDGVDDCGNYSDEMSCTSEQRYTPFG